VTRLGVLRMMVARSLRQHALSTAVTALSVALASGLVLSVYSIQEQTRAAFVGSDCGFDAVVGARGSQLQLVLNTVFHLDASPGNIPWSLYQKMRTDPRVTLAVPYGVGDNYRGWRIVGTLPSAFPADEVGDGGRLRGGLGRVFDVERREAVVGSFAAQRTGLTVGSHFKPYHGTDFDDKSVQHDEDYVVVGVRAPTNSPADRVVWIPLEGIYRMGPQHVLRGGGAAYSAKEGEAIPDDVKEVSAVLLKLRSPADGFAFDEEINKRGTEATFAYPIGRVAGELFAKVVWVHDVLALVADLVCVVAAASILASIYNTINERRREFAILRALGARRSTVFAAIVTESAAISAIGAAAGFVVYVAIMLVAAAVVRAQTGVVVSVFEFHPVLVVAPLGMTALGAVCGLVPAFKAYRTDVAANLAPSS
jgi:putative ABC transport system permease protein